MITYAVVVLLGWPHGFRLTLAGVTGLIVAIGITADSFIVYFERVRDEVREGRSAARRRRDRLEARPAHDPGRRRRSTSSPPSCSTSLAVGDVRGFAFTLGLTTLIDIVVVFLFTHPLVTILARTKFFGEGHRCPASTPSASGTTLAEVRRPWPGHDRRAAPPRHEGGHA